MRKYDLNDPEFITVLGQAFDKDDFQVLLEMIRSLHPADQANLFNSLKTDQKETLLQQMEVSEIADIFDELDDRQTLAAAINLPLPFLADIIDDMDPDEAADLLGDMPGQEVKETISLMEESEEILPLLRYPHSL